jgi:beta-glucosidase
MLTDQRNLLTFPPEFIWGAATSAYQIEGAPDADGKGRSIWDVYAHTPGKTYQGAHGDTAAGHYHRWREDIALMQALGLQAYRFSVSWPRILPAGSGEFNPKGLDFYDRLIDGLLAAGIQPVVTLYHWDLPQALQEAGGWTNRALAQHFADYAAVLARRFGDRVGYWITHNEPWVIAIIGHLTGQVAPGLQDLTATVHAVHHLLLSHGLAVQAIRANLPRPAPVGIALNLSPVYPASDSAEDTAAAHLFDGVLNRLFLQPVFKGEYPHDLVDKFEPYFPAIEPGDLPIIAAPLDFLGVNYYTRAVIQHDPGDPLLSFRQIHPPGNEYSQMWEIYPEGLYELLMRLHRDYPGQQIFITENGICVADAADLDRRVRDRRRIEYLSAHLAQAHRAIQHGAPVFGYLVWSLMDNFEWSFGYRMRFGLIHIDFDTQERVIKDSGFWFRDVIRRNGLPPAGASQSRP